MGKYPLSILAIFKCFDPFSSKNYLSTRVEILSVMKQKLSILIKLKYTGGWIMAENMWLQRMAITFQRYFKQETDEKRLFDYIRRTAHSNEFFIQKGAGWVLREYAKINPTAVIAFCDAHKLAALTRREALRHLVKNGQLSTK